MSSTPTSRSAEVARSGERMSPGQAAAAPSALPAPMSREYARKAHTAHQVRRRLGWRLLRDAVLRTLQVADQVGVRALLAHALDQAAADFYARCDFQASPADPPHMVLLLKDARALLRITP